MEWLNLRTSFLHAPEYIGSDPRSRATWLNVSLWCAQQENGGRIVGAKSWKDRQWQQTCGVTTREVMAADALLSWDGDDLTVSSYPVDKEAVVKFNREAGRRGGSAKTQAKTQAAKANGASGGRPQDNENNPSENQSENPSENPSETQATLSGITQAITQAKTQRNRKGIGIGIGKEEEGGTASRFPSLNEWIEEARAKHPDWPEADATKAWGYYESQGWKRGKSIITRWRACIATCYANFKGGPNYANRNTNQRPNDRSTGFTASYSEDLRSVGL